MEQLEQFRIISRCSRCGEFIRDGDAAYLLTDRFYCPGCVEQAFIIARPRQFYPAHRYSRRGNTITDFPAGIPRHSAENTLKQE